MKVDGCAGQCCAVFPWPTKPAEMRRLWEDVPRADGDTMHAGNGIDQLMIANMLVPLTTEEARERSERFGINPKFVDLCVEQELDLYTCKNWDEESRTCTVYDARPDMCASYPYERECYHCRETGGCSLQDHQWRKKRAD